MSLSQNDVKPNFFFYKFKILYVNVWSLMSLRYNILAINRLNVLLWTPKIFAIWDLEMPLASKFRTFLAFFESLSFFDSAENGRPSFLPEALRLARDDFVRWDIRFLSISAAKPKAKAKTLLCISLPNR